MAAQQASNVDTSDFCAWGDPSARSGGCCGTRRAYGDEDPLDENTMMKKRPKKKSKRAGKSKRSKSVKRARSTLKKIKFPATCNKSKTFVAGPKGNTYRITRTC